MGITKSTYQLLVEHSRDAFFVVTPEMKYIEVNPAACEMLGYTEEELLNLKIPDIALTKHNEQLHAFNALIKKGEVLSEIHIKTKSGRKIPAEINAVKLPDGNFLGILRDISKRKEIEEELKESEKKYRKLIESSPNAIIICHNKKIIYANKSAVELFGFNDSKEIKGFNLSDFVKLDYRKKFEQDLKHIVNKDMCQEYVFINNEFRKMVVEVKGIPFNYKNNKTAFLIIKDVSSMKKHQEEQLKMEKLESLSVFAGGVAHDFNNLLTIIKGNISLIEYDMNINKDPTSKIIEIKKAVKQTQYLTQQLLTYCKGELYEKEVMNIEELLREDINLILSNYDVKCKINLEDNLYPVEIDRSQINQVINNIVINAVQSMNEKGTIYVTAENIKDGSRCCDISGSGKYVKITIKDEGRGISAQDMIKIFDPFFTTKDEGSGLGLAVSYSVIKRHCGYLTVNSELGKGSEFGIYIPASEKKIQTDHYLMERQLSFNFGVQ
jgi:PAS domain S-box-containing protein